LGAIHFEPSLSEVKRSAIALGQAGIGSKVMLKIRTTGGLVSGMHPNHPFGFVSTMFDLPGDEQILVCFGQDGDEIVDGDLAWAQRELDRAIPGCEVIGMNWHDWKSDEFAQGTWGVHRPGWYTNHHAEMQRPEGRVILSNSDWAEGWAGFVDGAIESGIRGGRLAAGMVH
jgi:hypothetical protein